MGVLHLLSGSSGQKPASPSGLEDVLLPKDCGRERLLAPAAFRTPPGLYGSSLGQGGAGRFLEVARAHQDDFHGESRVIEVCEC